MQNGVLRLKETARQRKETLGHFTLNNLFHQNKACLTYYVLEYDRRPICISQTCALDRFQQKKACMRSLTCETSTMHFPNLITGVRPWDCDHATKCSRRLQISFIETKLLLSLNRSCSRPLTHQLCTWPFRLCCLCTLLVEQLASLWTAVMV